MRTVSKAILALVLLWSVGALAQQPAPYLPNPELTPGDVFDVTIEDICTPGYAKKVRAVPKALRDQAFNSYGIMYDQRNQYQLDHLIPLALGGSNSIKNLFPLPNYTSPWNARVKDRLEVRLQKLVCSGQVDLETAQREIAANWTEAYERFMGASPPAAAKAEPLLAPIVVIETPPPTTSAPNATENEVWVNTRSGVYWKPGSQYFGKTAKGKLMTESDAVAGGYRPARGTGY
jgi:hypothetical protein